MPVTIETINGHQVKITTDDAGNEISRVNVDVFQPILKPLTKFQFRCLLTMPEKVAIDSFESNTSLSEDQKNVMRTFQFDFKIAESIDLTNSVTIQGVNALESYGLLGTGRAAAVLANRPLNADGTGPTGAS